MLAAVTGERYVHEFQRHLLADLPPGVTLSGKTRGGKVIFRKAVTVPDEFKNCFLSMDAARSRPDAPLPEFEFRIGSSPWLKSGDFLLNIDADAAQYNVPARFFAPPGTPQKLESIEFRRRDNSTAALTVRRVLLRGSRNEQPLAVLHSKISVSGGEIFNRTPHGFSW